MVVGILMCVCSLFLCGGRQPANRTTVEAGGSWQVEDPVRWSRVQPSCSDNGSVHDTLPTYFEE